MTFGSGEGIYGLIGAVDQNGADELVKGALDRGVNCFDTADV
jgi:aryl-alcohol dehydrogenase-like predicted oxidoreductase